MEAAPRSARSPVPPGAGPVTAAGALLAAGLALAGAPSATAAGVQADRADRAPASTRSAAPHAPPAPRDTASVRIPDVPFVAQTEALCGGAAVSMVLRYWGERGVAAGDFRHLVSGRPAGIRTDDLLDEVRARGWRARRVDGSPESVAGHLQEGRPVIALIRVAPERFHYVVALALTPERALYHDPADGPYRVMGRAEWDEAREAADRWAALALAGEGPPADGSGGGSEAAGVGSAGEGSGLPEPCGSLVEAGVREARAGEAGETAETVDTGAAEEALRAAAELCPGRPEPWSELAGLRFREESYGEAALLARRAAERADGGDEYPWRLRGAALYLFGDRRDALRAWNRIGAPAVDHVRVQGLGRGTRHRPALDLLGLEPGTTLTPGGLLRGRRRLAEMPALRRSRVDFRALEGDRVEVRVAAWERRPPTASPTRAAAVAVRAAADRTVRLSWPSPTGGGELVSAAWRWTPGRPALSLEARAPAPAGVAAVWGAEGGWERQSYAAAADPPDLVAQGAVAAGPDDAFEEERRRAALSAAEWLTGRLRARASASLDRWTGGRLGPGDHSYLGGGLGAEWRTAEEEWTARVRAGAWLPLADGRPSFRSLRVHLRRELGEPGRGLSGTIRAGVRRASDGAPLALWPGAGTGRGRTPLLRAHPLLEDGRVAGPAFGRSLAHGGAEATIWPGGIGPARLGVAGFVDAAAAARRAAGWPGERAHVDAGTGLRLRVGPGGGTLRLDAAVGLRDGRTALSAGWTSSDGGLARP